jgi:transcriptional regulator GlxA family with amidase domain
MSQNVGYMAYETFCRWRTFHKMKPPHFTQRKRIGILVFEDVTALDACGPLEAFATARAGDEPTHCYEILTIGLTPRSVRAESGLRLLPDTVLAKCPPLDTLIIPGGRGLRRPSTNKTAVDWICSRASTTRRIVSICTGIYALAATGLLDGCTVTTHWNFADDVARRFPALKVDSNVLYLKQGALYTSAGITAGIDLSLALIEEDFGRACALAVARELVVYMKRAGGQEQYSEPLRYQASSTDRLAEIAAYIQSNLRRNLSVNALADRAHLSNRQLSRQFKLTFGMSPAAFVESVRINEARKRLCEPRCNIGHLASAIGFTSDDAFRRAFSRRMGISPSAYRSQFGPSENA